MSGCVEENTSFKAVGLLLEARATYHCIVILLLILFVLFVLFASFVIFLEFVSLKQVLG